MKSPLVSFISVNYNGYNDTCELINSLLTHINSVSFEIIIIDNASKVDESVLLKKNFPQIISIRTPENLGFSGGNNLGILHAKGKFLFFINNDTYIEEDNIISLTKFLEANPIIGGVSPKIKFAFQPQKIQFAGYTPLSPITIRNTTIGYGEIDSAQYNSPQRTSYLHGAAMLIKREVVEKVGMMPEIFFLYYEELDWCTQITKAGYELWYVPSLTVFHKESQSTGQESYLQVFYLTRNRLLYAWRNLNQIKKWVAILYLMSIPLVKNLIKYTIKRKPNLIKATFCGVYAFITLQNKRIGIE
ncbi:glycosyltransferase family 2 protein [Bacteroides sp. 224]|uniref:glycosyltransferase family 2 protein n=1 Tax=Bacteroides sp. 224 TaxID=2302936 RepID=UPI0013D7F141|nr:glycosyltransferase family 2 protein [Bacteroides sp. 224]NDV65181.1 glycosyltransferase family 2 protein [Bacteroides sp. 224]